jgi:alpha-D-xyloside xylohydrolase
MNSDATLWMSPLAAEWPDDATAATLTSQWLDGALLVAPIMQENSSSRVYLPTGTWYRFNSSSTTQGPTTLSTTAELGEIPVYAPPGTIVPLAPILQYTDALPGGPLNVHVYGGSDGKFTLVEDDGETTGYATKGLVRRTALAWDDSAATLSWTVTGKASGGATFTQLHVTLFADGQAARYSPTVTLDGKAGSVKVPSA